MGLSLGLFLALASLDSAREAEERGGEETGGTAERDVTQPPRADPPGVSEVHVRLCGQDRTTRPLVDLAMTF